jgi:hypothetical protein
MRYRARPVVIEAVRYDGDTGDLPYEFGTSITRSVAGGSCYLQTLEGEMRCYPGDYIVRGLVDELYPCKAEIFEKLYEQID